MGITSNKIESTTECPGRVISDDETVALIERASIYTSTDMGAFTVHIGQNPDTGANLLFIQSAVGGNFGAGSGITELVGCGIEGCGECHDLMVIPEEKPMLRLVNY